MQQTALFCPLHHTILLLISQPTKIGGEFIQCPASSKILGTFPPPIETFVL